MSGYKYIIEELCSKRDRKGNTYHAARVISVSNPEQVAEICLMWSGQARNLVRQGLGVDMSQIYTVTIETGIREFNNLTKGFKPNAPTVIENTFVG